MSENETHGGVVLKWAHLILLLAAQIVAMAAVYGALRFQVEDHARRLDAIEKKQDANFIPRQEYDKRHDDLVEQVRELRNQIRDLERKIR